MTAVPGRRAAILPLPSTVATVGSLDSQIRLVISGSSGVMVTSNVVLVLRSRVNSCSANSMVSAAEGFSFVKMTAQPPPSFIGTVRVSSFVTFSISSFRPRLLVPSSA